jgi:hypothetical protein
MAASFVEDEDTKDRAGLVSGVDRFIFLAKLGRLG